MLTFIFVLLIISILINGLLIFLLYRSYKLYLNEEVEKHMLKDMLEAMYDRVEKCKSDDLSNKDDFPEKLKIVPEAPRERIFMDYLTGEIFTEEQYKNLNFKERLENRRKLYLYKEGNNYEG